MILALDLHDVIHSWKSGLPEESLTFTGQLSLMMANLRHVDQEIRREGLSHLKQILSDSEPALVTGNIAVTLMSSLIKGYSVENEELLKIYSECFGLVGAIDPAMLKSDDEHSCDPIDTVELFDNEFIATSTSFQIKKFGTSIYKNL